MRRSIQTLILTALVAILACAAFAQAAGRGTVTGRVIDAGGAAVAGVQVAVTSDVAPSYKQTATTNSNGEFTARDVPVGQVTAAAVTANNVERASAKASLAGNGGTVSITIQIPAGK